MKRILIVFLLLLSVVELYAQIINADARVEEYLPLIRNKKVAVVCNHTSVVGNKHILQILLENNIDIAKAFTPEHGLNGINEAGALVNDSTIKIKNKTINVISLYGKNKKPTKQQMKGVEVVLFDLQDVGCRFYTYISTLEYVMQSCLENNILIVVLDRPNPNNYVDGSVLKTEYKSFVGMQPIPICYGLTIGEYATMINSEHWINDSLMANLVVVPLLNYKRSDEVILPISPSPNLRTAEAIRNYPTLCLFEGTSLSVGRGTPTPFEKVGYKDKNTKQMTWIFPNIKEMKIDLTFIIDVYKNYKGEKKFFNSFFDKLAGTSLLKKQIEEGLDEKTIRATWQKDLENYLLIRNKYLIYPN